MPALWASRLPSELGEAFVKRLGLWTPYVEWTQNVAEDGPNSYTGRYEMKLDLGLMSGGSTENIGGRRYGARMSLGLSDALGPDAEDALLQLGLSYEF